MLYRQHWSSFSKARNCGMGMPSGFTTQGLCHTLTRSGSMGLLIGTVFTWSQNQTAWPSSWKVTLAPLPPHLPLCSMYQLNQRHPLSHLRTNLSNPYLQRQSWYWSHLHRYHYRSPSPSVIKRNLRLVQVTSQRATRQHLNPKPCQKGKREKESQWRLGLVFASPVQSGFLPSKQATMNHNWSRTDPDIVGTKPDHLGPVFCSPWNSFRPVQTGFSV